MKKLFIFLSILSIIFSGCAKDESVPFDAAAQAATDDALIQTYIKANNITAVKDPSGLYYQILTPGTGAYPTATSTISVNYSGKLLNGTTFDSGTLNNQPLSPTANSNGLIPGWIVGIPKINTGGRILLLVPSGLGYGNSSPGAGIPANAVLVFTIDLIGFR